MLMLLASLPLFRPIFVGLVLFFAQAERDQCCIAGDAGLELMLDASLPLVGRRVVWHGVPGSVAVLAGKAAMELLLVAPTPLVGGQVVCLGVFGGAPRCVRKIRLVFVVPGCFAGPSQVLIFPLDGINMEECCPAGGMALKRRLDASRPLVCRPAVVFFLRALAVLAGEAALERMLVASMPLVGDQMVWVFVSGAVAVLAGKTAVEWMLVAS